VELLELLVVGKGGPPLEGGGLLLVLEKQVVDKFTGEHAALFTGRGPYLGWRGGFRSWLLRLKVDAPVFFESHIVVVVETAGLALLVAAAGVDFKFTEGPEDSEGPGFFERALQCLL